MNPERFQFIVHTYTSLMSAREEQGKLSLNELLEVANMSLPSCISSYSLPEVEAILRRQQSENRLMYDETNGRHLCGEPVVSC